MERNTDVKTTVPMVLESAAGFYIGTLEYDRKTGEHLGPYERLSWYFSTKEEAEFVLHDEENW